MFAEILTLVQSGELLVRDRATGSLQRVSIQGLSRSMLTLEDVSNNVAPIALALERVTLPPARGFAVSQDGPQRSAQDRLSTARAAMNYAEAATGLSRPPGKGLLSVPDAAARIGCSVARLEAALGDGKFEGAVRGEDGAWWVPAAEARPQSR